MRVLRERAGAPNRGSIGGQACLIAICYEGSGSDYAN